MTWHQFFTRPLIGFHETDTFKSTPIKKRKKTYFKKNILSDGVVNATNNYGRKLQS